MRTPVWRWMNTVAFLLVLLVNWLANAIPIGGRTTGEVSAMFPVLVSPASYAFSIWGLIYVLLAGFVWLQWLPRWRDLPIFRRLGPWFVVSCIFNILWILLWHLLYTPSSVFIMIALLLTLSQLFRSTRRVPNAPRDSGLVVKLFVQLPFSLYFGWITVATLVNISIGLLAGHWFGWGLEVYWAVLVLLLGTLGGYAVFRKYRDVAYVLTIVWAYVAIGVQQQDIAPILPWFAWLCAAFLLLLAVGIIPVRRKQSRR
jgi:benzodiazapine receptor